MGLVGLLLAVAGIGAVPAQADSPWWGLTSGARPSHLQQGGENQIVVAAQNRGDVDANGKVSPVRIVDRLPANVKALSVAGVAGEEVPYGDNRGPVDCALVAPQGGESQEIECTFDGVLPAYEEIEIRIAVEIEPAAATGEENEVSVFGGGGAPATLRRAIQVGETTSFGIENYELLPEEIGGEPATQAGSHPFQLTTVLQLDQTFFAQPPELPKDLHFDLPPGLIGNPTPFAQCSDAQFGHQLQGGVGSNECGAQTAIGVALITYDLGKEKGNGLNTMRVPLFNLTPRVGEPARFGFEVGGAQVTLDASLRTGGDYGVTVSVNNITQLAGFLVSKVTFWGVPGDSRHNAQRGWACIGGSAECVNRDEREPAPLLILPTSCEGSLATSVRGDSWQNPGAFTKPVFSSTPLPGMEGCNHLPFSASISVAPDSQAGSTATGLTVGIHIPQQASLNAEGLAQADVKDTTVTLPAGVAVNPAAGDGLLSCSEAQIALSADVVPVCPDASKVATVEIRSPLLPNPLDGAVYLAAQNANPFGSLVALYLVAQDPVSGTLVKLAGEVKLDPLTGQLVSTFLNSPQLPFEDLSLHFFGGDRAPLGTPATCGAYETKASIAPWSGNAPAEPSSTFDITTGPNGAPCQSPLPFNPSLTAGTTSIQAGGFSPFTMTVSREDGQQNIEQILLHMPPGLSGLLSGVELCPEVQANAGSCGLNSLIGETTVSVGLGGDPYSVRGGKVYITGPYEGAPFGIAVVVRAKAGPYDFGTVVVRGRIEVDPTTSALTVTTNSPSQGYAIPRILDGIPLEIKHVNFVTTRPGFTFDPTNCDPMAVTGSVSSFEGASSAVSVPFQVTNCAVLGFKPQLSVSTSGKNSRANGASLHVKLVYPKAAFGSQANIGQVKVDLPKRLPSRLTTLQKACPDSTFNTNPAACSAASRIGTAKATTPLIPVPLEGPVYFVSHGGAKFPELIVVLSGYGVTVDLHSETFINGAGITSSTFRTIPDVPVGTFELTLPQGPFSALAANGNLCSVKGGLRMPTAFTAQNGLVVHHSTPISVTGCPKHSPNKTKKARKTGDAKRTHAGKA